MSLSAMIISAEKLSLDDFKTVLLKHDGFVSAGIPSRGSVGEGDSTIWLALHSKDILDEFYDGYKWSVAIQVARRCGFR